MTISNQRKRISEVESQLVSTQEELGQAQSQIKEIEEQKEAELPPTSEENAATQDSEDGAQT